MPWGQASYPVLQIAPRMVLNVAHVIIADSFNKRLDLMVAAGKEVQFLLNPSVVGPVLFPHRLNQGRENNPKRTNDSDHDAFHGITSFHP